MYVCMYEHGADCVLLVIYLISLVGVLCCFFLAPVYWHRLAPWPWCFLFLFFFISVFSMCLFMYYFMCVCMYACVYLCMNLMYLCVYACIYACVHVFVPLSKIYFFEKKITQAMAALCAQNRWRLTLLPLPLPPSPRYIRQRKRQYIKGRGNI